MPMDTVPQRHGAVQEEVPTSPVLLEYTTFMRGVDVANQLQDSNSSQTQSHNGCIEFSLLIYFMSQKWTCILCICHGIKKAQT